LHPLKLFSSGLPVFAGAVALVACGASPSLPVGRLVSQQGASAPERGGSWMEPQAKAENLLYISLVPGGVYVFSYPDGKRVGKLTGSEEPNGECVDEAGDVFITDTERSNIVEYAHGVTKPIATLDDPGNPWDCSIDLTTGNLAVANVSDVHSHDGQGEIEIYEHASGTPKKYSDRDLYAALHCSYDGDGNLFITGQNWSLGSIYLELRKSSRTFKQIHLKRIRNDGGVKWDGAYIAVSAGKREIYRTVGARIVGTTLLKGRDFVGPFWIQHSTVIVADGGGVQFAGFWNYPAGGKSTKTIPLRFQPAGVAVSMRE
jgi:hypothetical protein